MPNFKINREYVLKDMEKKIQMNAALNGMSVDDYKKIRSERKRMYQADSKVITNIYALKQKNSKKIEIVHAKDFKWIRGAMLKLQYSEKRLEFFAYITNIEQQKPNIIGDLEALTAVEKAELRRNIFWYFSDIKRSEK